MWFGIPDDLLVPLATQPAQFYAIWSHSTYIPPERELALAVMEQAIDDLAHNRFAKARRGQRAYWDAYDWVAAEDREWPFSFLNLCDALGLHVESTRRRVLDTTLPSNVCAAPFADASEAKLGNAA
jgi:hypothetical protein